jgi:hypothetical protein
MPEDISQLSPEALTAVQRRVMPTREGAAQGVIEALGPLGEAVEFYLQPTKPRPDPARFGYFALPLGAAGVGAATALEEEPGELQ